MKNTLKFINNLLATTAPSDYSDVSYNKYYRDLAGISDSIINEEAALKAEVLKIEDESLKLKILSLI